MLNNIFTRSQIQIISELSDNAYYSLNDFLVKKGFTTNSDEYHESNGVSKRNDPKYSGNTLQILSEEDNYSLINDFLICWQYLEKENLIYSYSFIQYNAPLPQVRFAFKDSSGNFVDKNIFKENEFIKSFLNRNIKTTPHLKEFINHNYFTKNERTICISIIANWIALCLGILSILFSLFK